MTLGYWWQAGWRGPSGQSSLMLTVQVKKTKKPANQTKPRNPTALLLKSPPSLGWGSWSSGWGPFKGVMEWGDGWAAEETPAWAAWARVTDTVHTQQCYLEEHRFNCCQCTRIICSFLHCTILSHPFPQPPLGWEIKLQCSSSCPLVLTSSLIFLMPSCNFWWVNLCV